MMIKLTLKGRALHLLTPQFPGETSTAEGWSRMRWIVAGPGTPAYMVEALKEFEDPLLDCLGRYIEINDETIAADMLTRGINLAQLDVLWNYLGADLLSAKLVSEKLKDLCADQPFANWIYPQIQAVHSPIFDGFARRVREDPLFLTEVENAKLHEVLFLRLSETYVPPPPRIRELVVVILEHLHWLLIARFMGQVDFDHDVQVASLWLGAKFDDFLSTGTPHGMFMPNNVP